MKLLNKTIFYYLLISLPLLAIAGCISYYMMRNDVKEGTDESLWMEKINVSKKIRAFKEPHNEILSYDGLSSIKVVHPRDKGYVFSDTLIFEADEEDGAGEFVNYRLLKAYFYHNGTNYLITLDKPTLEEDSLIEGLITTLLVLFVFLMLAFFVVSWLLSKFLWKPFYKTVDALANYDLKNSALLDLSPTGTKEFTSLNDALSKMTDKIYNDYLHQKEFTENAAHEMQTPLAVMKAKLDLLIQSPHLKEEEMNQLQVIVSSVSKLASLNKALLLLAKIENNQFKDISEISIQKTIEKALGNYEDQIESKKITLKIIFTEDNIVRMNGILCDLLVSNLIQNAIRHNIEKGDIEIQLGKNSLVISNTGSPLNIKADELFVRFKKNDASKESLGLGLSIVKGITDLYGININYAFSEGKHRFTLLFSQN
ncbi:MAG: sensor histidine kinase [Bacteroidia bacterium]